MIDRSKTTASVPSGVLAVFFCPTGQQSRCGTRAYSSGIATKIRGGGFLGRNPKTGEKVPVPGKHVPHFKPGKELRERVITG